MTTPDQPHRPENAPPSAPIPRGSRTGVVIAVVAAFVVALVIGIAFGDRARTELAAMWNAAFGDASSDAEGDIQYYTCGMHPWVLLPHDGDCPICHMALEPVNLADFAGKVVVDPAVAHNIGVRTAPVTTGPLVRDIRTVGSIEYAEPAVRDISTKVDGWIEKLHIDSVGAPVKTGQPLFELFSPALYAAQDEYLLAYRNQRDHPSPASAAMLESARTRLIYFDVDEGQIAALEDAGQPSKTMTIRSPFDGVVIEKDAVEGRQIAAGARIYRLADLSRVWVIATIYEYQLPYITEGQSAMMTLPYIPGKQFEGKVMYVYPFLNAQTRQARVRLEFDNPDSVLKPGMFADVRLQSRLADEAVLAPRSAILNTGREQVAFVQVDQGEYVPRNVIVGMDTEDGRVEIRQGLQPGERVVTSAQFLLDSEARYNEARARMIRGDEPTGADHDGHDHAAVAPSPVQIKPVRLRATADGGFELTHCLVSGLELGAMGDPVPVQHNGRTIKFCCADCINRFRSNPDAFISAIDKAIEEMEGK